MKELRQFSNEIDIDLVTFDLKPISVFPVLHLTPNKFYHVPLQSSLLHYFLHTREESFFAAIRNRMHLSALAIKER